MTNDAGRKASPLTEGLGLEAVAKVVRFGASPSARLEWFSTKAALECASGLLYDAAALEAARTRGVHAGLADAHALVAAERERCARLAERHFIPGHSVAGPEFAAALADRIRKA